MAINLPDHPDRSRNIARVNSRTEEPCAICGKGIKSAKIRYMVHMHDGGDTLVTEAEAEARQRDPLRAGADMGCFPVGSECLRQHPEIKPYVTRA